MWYKVRCVYTKRKLTPTANRDDIFAF
jgi:hypothetical protein